MSVLRFTFAHGTDSWNGLMSLLLSGRLSASMQQKKFEDFLVRRMGLVPTHIVLLSAQCHEARTKVRILSGMTAKRSSCVNPWAYR
jgi:hypothetical protein